MVNCELLKCLALSGCWWLLFIHPAPAQNALCNGTLGPNVFPDGDLGSGVENVLPFDPGIAPGYWYTTDPPPVDGAYCVANSTVGWDWFAELFWVEMGDNSPDPNGYMMVVNASYQPGIFYHRTVDVCENTPYIFSADILNLFKPQFPDAILPNVDFLVNGNVVYATGDIPMTEQWQTYEFAFTTPPGAGQFTFTLRNNAPGGFGNDLALDNISLRFCRPTITLPVSVPNCGGPVVLQPTFSHPWPNAFYRWQTSTNNGLTWTNIPGANGPNLTLPGAASGQQFRLLMAGTPGNLNQPGCRSVSTMATITVPDYQTVIEQSICYGESYPLGNSWYSASGVYEMTVPAANGCDSTVVLELTVLPVIHTDLQASICEGESFVFGNQQLTLSGNYLMTLVSATGCDSLVTLALNMVPTIFAEIHQTICEGEAYFFNGEMRSIPGQFSQTVALPNGCDSMTTLYLEVLPVQYASLSVQLCEGEGFQFGSEWLTQPGSYSGIFSTAAGCDSVVTLDLAVLPILTTSISASICQGGNYLFGNLALTAAGIYQQTLQTAGGCDSVVTLNLAVMTVFSTTFSASICQGGSYPFGNQLFTTGGIYQQTYQTTSGCDSVAILSLAVLPTFSTSLAASICSGESYPFGNQAITAGGIYQQTYQTASGCDSVVTLSLAVLPIFSTSFSASICQGGSYLFGNQALTSAGVFQQSLQTTSGCDSVITLDLAVLPTFSTSFSASICEGGSYSFGNQLLTTGGIYQPTYQTTSGCDSVVTLSLSVLPVLQTQLTTQICSGEMFLFGSQSLTTAGIYQQMLTTSSGCDSVVTLALDVLPVFQTFFSAQICAGETFAFGNQACGTSGDFMQVFTAQTGCDSTVTLHLEVASVQEADVLVEVCNGEAFNGVFYQQNTLLTDTLSAAWSGCDSIVRTHITVLPTPQVTVEVFRCWGEPFAGVPIFSDTVVVQVGQTIFGCDSMVTYLIDVANRLTASILAPKIICSGKTAVLQTDGFGTYFWSTGETTAAISAQTAGDYLVTITNVQGCTATAAHHLGVSAMEVQADLLDPLCFGDENGEIHLGITGGVPPYLAALNGGDFSEKMNFMGLPAGLHRLRVEDHIGCTENIEEYLHSPPEFLLDMGGDLELKLGESVKLRAVATLPIEQYFWSPAKSLNCHDCPSPMASPLSATEYTLLAVSENGCEAEGQISVLVSKDEGVYVPTAFSPNGDGINDFFTLYPGRSVLIINKLLIFDRWGEPVFTVWNAPPYHPATQWHGNFREQPMQPAVFVWFAEIEYIDGSTTLLRGGVVLMK